MLSPDLAYLRRLVLDGEWGKVEAFAVGDGDDGNEGEQNSKLDFNSIRAHCRTQHFLETLEASGSGESSGKVLQPPDPDVIVQHLESLRDCLPVEDDEKSKRFDVLCAILQLDDLHEFPPLHDWSVMRGRLLTFAALAEELQCVYPDGGTYARAQVHNADAVGNGTSKKRVGKLEGLMRLNVSDEKENDGVHQSRVDKVSPLTTSGRPGRVLDVLRASFAASASYAKIDVGRVGAISQVGVSRDFQHQLLGDEKHADQILEKTKQTDTHTNENGNKSVDPHRTSSQLRHADLMGAFDGVGISSAPSTSCSNNSGPKFMHAGDVIAADAGVRCVVRAPDFTNHLAEDCFGLGTFAAASSSRTVHVTGTYGGQSQESQKLQNVHPAPCSIYAIDWRLTDANFGTGIIATGANDGSVALIPTRRTWNDGSSSNYSSNNTVFGTPVVTPRAVDRGAVRAVAFVGSSGTVEDSSASDSGMLVAGGGGDFAVKAWHLDETGSLFTGPGVSFSPHRDTVVSLVPDPETRWLLCSASPAGEVFLWDLRDRSVLLGCRPSMKVDVTGVCGDGVALASATIRGGRVACGFQNGGVAAVDVRRGTNAVAFSKGHDAQSSANSCVVWSDIVHDGECRSVDIAPRGSQTSTVFSSSFAILSAGFDGACRVIDASGGASDDGWKENTNDAFGNTTSQIVWQANHAHADKVVAARFGRNGSGFVSCGTDRVVKAWTLQEERGGEL